MSCNELSTIPDLERLSAARSCFKIWALLTSASLEREFRKEVMRPACDCSKVGALTWPNSGLVPRVSCPTAAASSWIFGFFGSKLSGRAVMMMSP